jgi:hypothetical protein
MQQIIGFEAIQQQLLQQFWQEKLPHAIILAGNKGIGKATFATQFAYKIDAETKIICKQDNKTIITIDQIREMRDFLQQNSIVKQHKVLIIDSICSLNKAASNALLKPLEEPLNNTFLLLIAHQLNKVLPTILSRCRLIKIPALNFANFSQIIEQNNQISLFLPTELELLSCLCGNSPAIVLQYGKNLLIFYQLWLESFIQNHFQTKLNKFIQQKDFDFIIFEMTIYHFLANWLKFKTNHQTKFFFTEQQVFSSLHSNTSQIIALQEFINSRLTAIKIFHLDKKLAIINIFNKILQ